MFKHPNELEKEYHMKLIYRIILIKYKKDSRVKGRICNNSRLQQLNIVKGEVASLIVANESVIIILVHNNMQDNCIAITGIPNTYLFDNIEDETVIIKMRGILQL